MANEYDTKYGLIFEGQANANFGKTLHILDKVPLTTNSIFDTYDNMMAYVNNPTSSAIQGLTLAVINDTDDLNNGIYYIKEIGTKNESGEVVKLATIGDNINTDSIDLTKYVLNETFNTELEKVNTALVGKLDSDNIYIWNWDGSLNGDFNEDDIENVFNNIENADIVILQCSNPSINGVIKNKQQLGSRLEFTYNNLNGETNTVIEYKFGITTTDYTVEQNEIYIPTNDDYFNINNIQDYLGEGLEWNEDNEEIIVTTTNGGDINLVDYVTTSALTSELNAITTNYTEAIATAKDEAINSANSYITNEASARTAADNELQGLISNNTSAITELENTVITGLSYGGKTIGVSGGVANLDEILPNGSTGTSTPELTQLAGDGLKYDSIENKLNISLEEGNNSLLINNNNQLVINAATGITADSGGLHLDNDYITNLISNTLGGSGLTYDVNSKKLSIITKGCLNIDESNRLYVKTGFGLHVDDNGGLNVDENYVTNSTLNEVNDNINKTINKLESEIYDVINNELDSLNNVYSKVKTIKVNDTEFNTSQDGEQIEIKISSGLTIDTNGIQANLGDGLGFDTNGQIQINVGSNYGIDCDESGLSVLVDEKSVTFSLNDKNKKKYLSVKTSSGLTVDSSGISVNLGNGLAFDENNKLTVTASTNSDDIDLSNYVTNSALTSALSGKLDSNKVYILNCGWNGEDENGEFDDNNAYNNIKNAEVVILNCYNLKFSTLIKDITENYGQLITFNCVHNKFDDESNDFVKYEFNVSDGYHYSVITNVKSIPTLLSDLENDVEYLDIDGVKSYLGTGLAWDNDKEQITVTASTNGGDINLDDYVTNSALTSELNNINQKITNTQNSLSNKLDSNKVYVWNWDGKIADSKQDSNENALENIKNADIVILSGNNKTYGVVKNKINNVNMVQFTFDWYDDNNYPNTVVEYQFIITEEQYSVEKSREVIIPTQISELVNDEGYLNTSHFGDGLAWDNDKEQIIVTASTYDDTALQQAISDLSGKTITSITANGTGVTISDGVADISLLLPSGGSSYNDTELRGLISAETTARETADNNIKNLINSLIKVDGTTLKINL